MPSPAHSHRTARFGSPLSSGGRQVIVPALNPGFSLFWLFNTPGVVPNAARPGFLPLSPNSPYSWLPGKELLGYTSDGSQTCLDTGVVPSQLGMGGNASRSLFAEYYHPDDGNQFSLVTFGDSGNNNLFEITKQGYYNVFLGCWNNDHTAAVAPGYGDSIVRLVVVYDAVLGKCFIQSLSRRPGSMAWTAYSFSESMAALTTPDVHTVQVLGSTFRSGSPTANSYVASLGLAPVAFDATTRQRLLQDPYAMLRPASPMLRGNATAAAPRRRPFMCVVS